MNPPVLASLEALPLPLPDERLGDGDGGDLTADLELVLDPRADMLIPPDCPDERAVYRWVLGHHLAFGVWRMLLELLEDMLGNGPDEAGMAEAAWWYDRYSAAFLYAGSCTPETYERVVRIRMAAAHPAFSGLWARDYERVLELLRKLAPPAGGVLKQAVKRNRFVHMAVAKTLVPHGDSLLKETGKRASEGATDVERDIFDGFFRVRREPVSCGAFRANLMRRVAAVRCDLTRHPVVPGRLGEAHRQLPGDLSRTVRDIATALARSEGKPMEQDKRIQLTPRISEYVSAQAEPPIPAQRELIEVTAALGGVAEMQIPHEQAVFLTLLSQSIGAGTIVEVGTFTGYSTLALARGLAPGGVVHTYDISDDWTAIATTAWKESGVLDRIQHHIGPAAEALAALPDEPVIDLAFLDADKTGYVGYWEELVPRMRPGGLILADNVLYYGEAADDQPTGNGLAIKEFNAHVRADDRVESVLLSIADGLTIARRKD